MDASEGGVSPIDTYGSGTAWVSGLAGVGGVTYVLTPHAVAFHLGGLRAAGYPVPEPTSYVTYVEVAA